jgi:hypothetical protein
MRVPKIDHHPLIQEQFAKAADPEIRSRVTPNRISFGNDSEEFQKQGLVAASFDAYALAAGINRKNRRRIKAIYRAKGIS